MNTWTELIGGPPSSEMLQLERLFQEMIGSITLIALFAVIIFFALVGLFAVLDRLFLKDEDIRQVFKVSKTGEQHPDSSGDQYSKPTTRLLLNDTNAAA
jgi:hypothetical protein